MNILYLSSPLPCFRFYLTKMLLILTRKLIFSNGMKFWVTGLWCSLSFVFSRAVEENTKPNGRNINKVLFEKCTHLLLCTTAQLLKISSRFIWLLTEWLGVALESAKYIIKTYIFVTFCQDSDAKTSQSSTMRPSFSHY